MAATTSQKANPFKGRPKSGDGFDKTDIPSQDKHEARIIALIDLGTHDESFGAQAPKPVHSVYLAFELDEEMSGMRGVRHVVGQKYTLSFHEKANLCKLYESIALDGKKAPSDHDIDYSTLLGMPCEVQITHTTKAGDNGTDRTYVKINAISAVSKKQRERVFVSTRKAVCWGIDDDIAALPDWLPRLFGERIADVVDRSHERSGGGSKTSYEEDEGEVTSERDDPPF